MSSPIWTPVALQSETQPYTGRAWRLVEAQHIVSTMKLADSLAEQEKLEAILEESKPPVPAECRHLDYLLSTPFRYQPYPSGSRFRRAGMSHGVWYGAERPQTAIAEMAFYRALFYAESPDTPFPDSATVYTAFSIDLATENALDLTAGASAHDTASWMHLTDYDHSQTLAETARQIGVEIIRYDSVREPNKGCNLAVMSCRAFQSSVPVGRETWHIRISATGVIALSECPKARVEFSPDTFSTDPRLAGMDWRRAR